MEADGVGQTESTSSLTGLAIGIGCTGFIPSLGCLMLVRMRAVGGFDCAPYMLPFLQRAALLRGDCSVRIPRRRGLPLLRGENFVLRMTTPMRRIVMSGQMPGTLLLDCWQIDLILFWQAGPSGLAAAG